MTSLPSLMKADTSPSIADSSIHSSTADVGQAPYPLSAQVDTAVLTDEAREEAIKRAGQAVIRYMTDWERTGCFAARGDADRARRLMELLIAGRSAQQVQRMRSAQAKRMACEPGAERA